jgi:FKBP-type peptidyl-prolyl cis-trans isomerase (trigger factor)
LASDTRYAHAHMPENTTDNKATSYENVEIKELPGSEIEITGEVPVRIVESHRSRAVKQLTKELELPGFRKGHVPEATAIEHVGEQALLQQIAEDAIGKVYADIVMDNKLEVVGRPAVTITKLAAGNPIGFKIQSAVFPEVKLPDYHKLAKAAVKKEDDPEKVEVTDNDLDEELKRLQSMLTKPGEKGEDGKEGEPVTPEINDAFAQSLGEFKNLDELKAKIKEGMAIEKKQKTIDKRRLAIVDSIIAKTKMEVPAVFIDGELNQMAASFEDRVKRAGMEMDVYLKEAGKTMEELRKEWRVDAEKRAKMQLIFNEIAKMEKIVPDSEKLEREIGHIKEHYPDAEDTAVRTYVATQMVNELVFNHLEGTEGDK